MFYVQIPDSAPTGVLSAFVDAMSTFGVAGENFPRPTTLLEMAQTVGQLARAGYVVALDEFQYFARSKLHEFTSHLQAVVDQLSRDADQVRGGLFVLGSLHTELVALLMSGSRKPRGSASSGSQPDSTKSEAARVWGTSR